MKEEVYKYFQNYWPNLNCLAARGRFSAHLQPQNGSRKQVQLVNAVKSSLLAGKFYKRKWSARRNLFHLRCGKTCIHGIVDISQGFQPWSVEFHIAPHALSEKVSQFHIDIGPIHNDVDKLPNLQFLQHIPVNWHSNKFMSDPMP